MSNSAGCRRMRSPMRTGIRILLSTKCRIVKITSTMDSFVVAPAVLTHYEQYENSDCLNGAVLRVEDGYRFEENLASHHAVLAVGDLARRLDVVGGVLGLGMQRI